MKHDTRPLNPLNMRAGGLCNMSLKYGAGNHLLLTLGALILHQHLGSNIAIMGIAILSCNIWIFNESALRPIHSISRDVRLSVCVFVRHTLETTLPEGLETSGRMAYR